MKPSILRRLFFACMGFGLFMGAVFPFFALLFVEPKEHMMLWFSISCLAAGLTIGLVNYALVKVVLLKRLVRLADVADAIGKKDLSHHCSIESHDVVGRIAGSVNVMAENLRSVISQISHLSNGLSSAVANMSSVAAESSEHVRSQQQQTEQVATAMNEMATTVQEVAHHANDAASAAGEADEASDRGKQVISASVGAFDSLSSQMQSTSEVVQTLVHDSEKVNAVLEVIQGIAEQTNLLALNAAIEAARAGEQGRGFAVVADEVRTLASRTHDSTQEIQEIVERIRSGTDNAVNAMESTMKRTEESVDMVTEVAESLAAITSAVATISEMNTQIASAANEQKTVADEINRNISSINQSAGANAERAYQSRDDMARLNDMTSSLHRLIAEFKLVKEEPDLVIANAQVSLEENN